MKTDEEFLKDRLDLFETEGWRDQEERADKYQVTSRFGFGVQRADTLGVLLTDEATY